MRRHGDVKPGGISGSLGGGECCLANEPAGVER
jgi:hypothetical protein